MFLIHSVDGGYIPAIEYLPCSAIVPKIGMAMLQKKGKLAMATGTNAPTYISMCERDTACAEGDAIPVLRVDPGIIFETTISADAASLHPGDKIVIGGGAVDVDATTGGAAELVYIDGTESGSMVRVRFA